MWFTDIINDFVFFPKVKECAEKAEVSAVPAIGGSASASAKPAGAAATSTDGAKKDAPAKKPAQKQAKPAAGAAKPASAGVSRCRCLIHTPKAIFCCTQ